MKGVQISVKASQLVVATLWLLGVSGLATGQSNSAQIVYSTQQLPGVKVERILDQLMVSRSQLSALQTPIAVHNGVVYTANIEPGKNGDIDGLDLWTVVRKGSRGEDDSWHWSATLIEDTTVYNEWHTPPSIGVDSHGFVHVAYNMHNTPWQYKISTEPGNTGAFDFLGQYVSDNQLYDLKYENKTNFPDLGTAAIPGNQITYPRFSKDKTGKLFVAYRFASRPNRQFDERTMSAGIASYDVDSRQWQAIGAPIALEDRDWEYADGSTNSSHPFAASMGWTASAPQLAFGRNNELHVGMTWRQGVAGAQYSRPCVFQSNNNSDFRTPSDVAVSLPISAQGCLDNGIGVQDQLYNKGSMTIDGNGVIYYLAHSVSDGVVMFFKDPSKSYWERERGLNGISDLFVDREGSIWAVASGLRVLRRDKDQAVWRTVFNNDNGNDCFPRVILDDNKQVAYIHTHSCDRESVSLYSINLY